MKRLLCFVLAAMLLLPTSTVAYAKSNRGNGKNNQKKQVAVEQKKEKKNTQVKKQESKQNVKLQSESETTVAQNMSKKQEFKINGSPVIKYGKFKLPISPVTKGMGATVEFDEEMAVLTVTKDDIVIVINFLEKKATINGVEDTESGLFAVKNNNGMTVLIQYIANALGLRTDVDEDEVSVEDPELQLPSNITVTTVGGNIVANTLNSTTLALTVNANIKAGEAAGGKAELYIGSKLVATDATITETDTAVSFVISDGTPTNAELQAAVPTGGAVVVKLYNKENIAVSSKENPTLVVDYVAPVINNVVSAVYSVSGGAIHVNVNGAGEVGDNVDVTKFTLYDTALGRSYQLTGAANTGSEGVVNSANSLLIKLGYLDKLGLTGFGSSTVYLNVAEGSLLTDAAGNKSISFTGLQFVPVTIIQ